MRAGPVQIAALSTAVVALVWSGIHPADRLTWAMEIAPIVIGLALLLPTHRRFPLTNLLYGLIAFHCVVLAVGGKYTYAHVPLFDWIRDAWGLSRNHYDRVGHFVQGFVPAILIRELLLRTSPLRAGKWLFAIVVAGCLAFSAFYELVEWRAAVSLGSNADAFLAIQGDPWDTQEDMACCLVGAIVSLLTLSRLHDASLAHLAASSSSDRIARANS